MALQSAVSLQLLLDDVLIDRTGKKVALAGMHANPLLKKIGGRPQTSYGHVFVVLSVYVAIPALAPTGWALPVLFRLYEPQSQGGRRDAPTDRRRAAERRRAGKAVRHRVRKTDRGRTNGGQGPRVERPDPGPPPAKVLRKKTELGAELIVLLAQAFPALSLTVSADQLYNCKNVLHAVLSAVDNVHIVTQGRKDAALYALPPPRLPGQRGRSRVKGERLPSPEAWAAVHPGAFRDVEVQMYGRLIRLSVASFVALAHKSLPGRLVRIVVSRDPAGLYQTRYFLCTDTALDEVEILARYARRWTLERTFQDCKQWLCVENAQVQLPTAVRRAVPFGMLLYSLIVLWALQQQPHVLLRRSDPWYRPTTRPSFVDMRAALRRQSWAEARAANQLDAFDDYVDRVVTAA